MRYILNSAVITAPGNYNYLLLSPLEAKEWVEKGNVESYIGYEETSLALSDLLGIPIACNRKVCVMKKGDEALVFRLVFPSGFNRTAPENKGRLSIGFILKNHELGLLTKTS